MNKMVSLYQLYITMNCLLIKNQLTFQKQNLFYARLVNPFFFKVVWPDQKLIYFNQMIGLSCELFSVMVTTLQPVNSSYLLSPFFFFFLIRPLDQLSLFSKLFHFNKSSFL